jgi:hypothetical protein
MVILCVEVYIKKMEMSGTMDAGGGSALKNNGINLR